MTTFALVVIGIVLMGAFMVALKEAQWKSRRVVKSEVRNEPPRQLRRR
jgi:hypothetical protein